MTYIRKTASILKHLGYTLDIDFECSWNGASADLTWLSQDQQPTEQDIIDNELPAAKARKITDLKAEGLRRANLVYDDTDKVFPSVAAIKLLIDIDNTYDRSGAPAPRLITVNTLLATFDNAKAVINDDLLDVEAVEAYDVVNTPSWP